MTALTESESRAVVIWSVHQWRDTACPSPLCHARARAEPSTATGPLVSDAPAAMASAGPAARGAGGRPGGRFAATGKSPPEVAGPADHAARAVPTPGPLLQVPGTQGPLGDRPVVPSSPLSPGHGTVPDLYCRPRPVGATWGRAQCCTCAVRTRPWGSSVFPTHAAHELIRKTVPATGLFADFSGK